VTEPGTANNQPNSNDGVEPHQPIFFGADGLRAGWSLLIAILAFFALLHGLGLLAHTLHLVPAHSRSSEVTPGVVLITELIPCIAVLLTTLIMSKIEGRPFTLYGLGGSNKAIRLLSGTIWGLFFLSLLVFTLLKTGLLVIDSRLLSGSDIVRYALAWIPGFFIIGLFEETLFRGYLQYTLTRGLAGLYRLYDPSRSAAFGFWAATIILSFGFGFVHSSNPGESPVGLLSAALAALVFCLSLWRTGSLWWAIGFHAAWDWAQSFLYGVADSGMMVHHHFLATHPVGKPLFSGGTTGPEGSILVLPVLALIAAVIFITLPRGKDDYAALLPSAKPSLPDSDSLPDQAHAQASERHHH
jgi:CAAX protease family protein